MNVRSASGIRRDHLRFIGPFLSPGRNLSARLRDVSGIRRTRPQHIDLLPSSGWNPSASFRPGSKLRKAYHRTITSHRSPAKPSNKRQSQFQAPKSPSIARQLEIELRIEPFIERLANVRTPKRPSEGRRPDSQLRMEYLTELQNHLQAPKNLSATHRLESELPKTHHHSSSLFQGSEEPVNKPLKDSELPKNTSTNVRFASGIRRHRLQSVVSLPRTQRALWQAS